VRGVVTGLFGTGLGIQLNGGDTQVISSDGAFSFTTTVPDGNSYSVTVSQQPTDPVQSCAVAGGSGTVSGADVSDVEVFCSLQIATFNLLFFDAGNPTTKKQAIADIVTNAGFDFVGLQEVNNSTDLGAWVSAYLGASAWGWGTGASADGLQVGYIYRKRVLSVSGAEDLDYSTSSGTIDETAYPWIGLRLPLEVTLSIAGTGDTVSVLVNHLKCCTDTSACNKRAAQVQDIADWLEATAPAQQFIIGDLNDEIAGTGICSLVDTLSPLESGNGLVFLTEQPTYMSSSLYTNIPYTSTIDHIIATSDLFGRLYDVDGSGHKASVVMHGDYAISDHQPAYIHLAPQ
jgi:endonuclease/exonuclease/phosphatase family metal-dependent hydrolase